MLKKLIVPLLLSVQRVADHTYRYQTGFPMIRRSMITPQLFLGGQYGMSAVKQFRKLGITAIVNMRTTPIDKKYYFPNIVVLHLPTLDQHAPTLKQLQKGVQFISKHIKNGKKVYIHCKYGEGRGPTMAIAYFISQGYSFTKSFLFIKKIRTFINPTDVQIERLLEFEKIYVKK
jgi:protein-tyrosine phosphatase